MKSALSLLFILSLGQLCSAQTVLIQGPFANQTDYEKFLKEHPGADSYIHYVEKNLQKNPRQESQLIDLADSFGSDIRRTLERLKEIQAESPLTLLSLRYTRDLSEKALQQKLMAAEKTEFTHFYCKSAVLLNEGPSHISCSTEFISFDKLAKKFPAHRTVVIESISLELNEGAGLSMAPQTPYHWRFLSNSRAPIEFFGTYSQLMNQHFVSEYLIEGHCDEFSNNIQDFVLQERASVFFSADCVARLKKEQKKSWIKDKKTWYYIAGAVVLGGLAYSMRNKTLVVNTAELK